MYMWIREETHEEIGETWSLQDYNGEKVGVVWEASDGCFAEIIPEGFNYGPFSTLDRAKIEVEYQTNVVPVR
jgi:hypothetical protein